VLVLAISGAFVFAYQKMTARRKTPTGGF